MIICLSGFVIAGTSPTSLSSRNDVVSSATYAAHQQTLLQHLAQLQPHAPRPAHLAHRGGGARCSSSSESVSSHSASPPPARSARSACQQSSAAGAGAGAGARGECACCRRVRTLYACLGESEGELSFEPNQIITHVAPSGEPGWLRGTLDGRSGLVPENYVEPLP